MLKKQKQKQEKALLPACPDTGHVGGFAVELAKLRYQDEVRDAKDVQFLAKGGEGSVFRVKRKLQGQTPVDEVLKIIILDAGKKFSDITREYRILKGIESKGIHPNVIQPIGDLIEGKKDFTKQPSMEYCAYFMPSFDHSLYDLLFPKESVSIDRTDTHIELSFLERIEVLISVANAVHYLHSNFVIHRDVKPENIFLEFVHDSDGAVDELKVVLGDFGCAGIFDGKDKTIDLAKAIGSPAYMAPETRPLSGAPVYSEKTDAFSFGMLMWVIMTNEVPFDKLGRKADIATLVDQGERPDKYSGKLLELVKKELGVACFDGYYELMCSCWSGDSKARPDFSDICNKLRKIEVNYLLPRERSATAPVYLQLPPEKPSAQSKSIGHKRYGSRVKTLTDAEYAKLLGPRLQGPSDTLEIRDKCVAVSSLSVDGGKLQQEPSSSEQAEVSDEIKSKVLTLPEFSDVLRDLVRKKGKITLDSSNVEGFLRDLVECLPGNPSSVASSSLSAAAPQAMQRDEANIRPEEVSLKPIESRARSQVLTSAPVPTGASEAVPPKYERMRRPHASSVSCLGGRQTIFAPEAGSRSEVRISPLLAHVKEVPSSASSTFSSIEKGNN